MFCPRCGKEIMQGSDVCFGCGIMLDKVIKAPLKRVSAGWWWLGFFLPLVGLLLWIFLNDSEPAKAKKCGWGAIIGVIVSVALVVLYYLLIIVGFFLLTSM